MNLNYLTEEEIQKIIKDCKKFPYEINNMILPKNSKATDIKFWCPNTELILLQGNDDFGYNHIYERHFSSRVYINKGKKRENQNQFITIAPYQLMDLVKYIKKNCSPKQTDNILKYEYDNYILITDLNHIIITCYPKKTDANISFYYSKKRNEFEIIRSNIRIFPIIEEKEISISFKKISNGNTEYILNIFNKDNNEKVYFKDINLNVEFLIYDKNFDSSPFSFGRISNNNAYVILNLYIECLATKKIFINEVKKIEYIFDNL